MPLPWRLSCCCVEGDIHAPCLLRVMRVTHFQATPPRIVPGSGAWLLLPTYTFRFVRIRTCTRRTPTTPTGAYNAKTRASWGGPRVTSDSSTTHCGTGHDRTELTSTGTSYFESSGAESGNYGVESWRYGAAPAPPEAQLGGRFQGIYAQGDAGVSGTDDGAEDSEGADGTGRNRRTRLISAGEGDGGCGDEESSGDDSSSDGIGESASVADITDCLDFIGEVSQALWRTSSSS